MGQSSGLEWAERRIDEVAEVMHTILPPPGFDHTPVLGARAWESNVEGEDHH